MDKYNEVFVGLDVAKQRHAVAVVEVGRQGEVRYLGEINADPAPDGTSRAAQALSYHHQPKSFSMASNAVPL